MSETNKPKIYGTCPAGCLWETVHYEDFARSASHIKQNIGEDGKCYLEKGKEYKIFAPKDEANQFTCSLVFCFKASGAATEHAIIFTNEDKYAEWFTFRFLDYDATSDVFPIVYEVGGVRYTEKVSGYNNSVDEANYIRVTGATSVYLYNADASITAEKCFIRYSAYFDGTDFTEKWHDGQIYVGFASGQNAPVNKSEYEWVLLSTLIKINPLDVRKEGTYIIQVSREDDDSISSVEVFALDENGNENSGYFEFDWGAGEGTEATFTYTLEHDCYGLKITGGTVEAVHYTVETAIKNLEAEVEEANTVLIEPSNIRKAGTYTAKVVFELESENNYLEVFQIDSNGDNIFPPIYHRGYLGLGSSSEILPAENEFAIELPDSEYGFRFSTNAISCDVYVTTQEKIDNLDSKIDGKPSFLDLEKIVYEYERDIPYVAMGDSEYQKVPTVVALDRVQDGRVLDIISITISGYVNLDDGRACYFNQDITRQVQGVQEGNTNSFKMAGICSSLGNDSLSMYDFKLDIKCEGETFKMKAERVVVGDTFNGAQRSTSANLSNVKVRTILARKIKVV